MDKATFEQKIATAEELLVLNTQTLVGLSAGEIATGQANSIYTGIGTAIRMAKLDLEAAKHLNQTPVLLHQMLAHQMASQTDAKQITPAVK